MRNYNALRYLKKTLSCCIDELDSVRSLFVKNPETDFTRNRAISFPDTFWLLLGLQAKSMSNEILDFCDHSGKIPTSSAFIQQRHKVLTDAWHFLFHSFEDACSTFEKNTFFGFRLFGCDGSTSNICRNPLDEETFVHDGVKGYNTLHINALYDLLNHTYHDVIIQGVKKKDERSAFISMIERYQGPSAIFIADRGYESFNIFAHAIHAEQKFLIRLKDISSNGILARYDLPDEEFDINIDTILTRRRTKECIEHPEMYSILYNNAVFDFIDEENTYYKMSFRVVRFKTAGGYACVATNLSDKTFTTAMIKQLYRLRWNEETSFRELKYTIGLVNYHFRTREFILQEIYARLILYNFCELVVLQVEVKPGSKAELSYRINFATTVNICKEYLKHGGDEDEKMRLIQKYLTPIRPDRKYPLNVRPKKNRDFMYRIA